MVYLVGYALDLLAFGVLMFRYATVEDPAFSWYLNIYPSLILIFIGIRLVIVGRCKEEVFIYSYEVLERDKDWFLIFGYGGVLTGIVMLFI